MLHQLGMEASNRYAGPPYEAEDSGSQSSAVSSASAETSADDDCPDIMSDSDVSDDETIVWLSRRSVPEVRVTPSDDSSEQSCWDLLSDSTEDDDTNHSSVTLSRPRAHNKRSYPARRLKTAARDVHDIHDLSSMTTQVANGDASGVEARDLRELLLARAAQLQAEREKHTPPETVPVKVLS
ncbi:hypothetical protein SARC_13674 [Sphaeroforma arctica JP610]|uniref:Uncharacterized protein n=1 Tax=Sphaeroforma arctica JP610 TaxID=667725 RepID=A0A0L0FAJ7_9EUKA|nr:hypothetical protein SARC_13674 [Sphaeroforma arctica JP610]KNC73769.1 hypothetical protein SARC_13674 [Sphaeroforma arctica JP610]|eukprot:XP_014147671.1 hypothetical protein SARC_13674 [Sphaeroforma arctica JP610]